MWAVPFRVCDAPEDTLKGCQSPLFWWNNFCLHHRFIGGRWLSLKKTAKCVPLETLRVTQQIFKSLIVSFFFFFFWSNCRSWQKIFLPKDLIYTSYPNLCLHGRGAKVLLLHKTRITFSAFGTGARCQRQRSGRAALSLHVAGFFFLFRFQWKQKLLKSFLFVQLFVCLPPQQFLIWLANRNHIQICEGLQIAINW